MGIHGRKKAGIWDALEIEIRKVTMDHYSQNRLLECWCEATATFILDEIEVGFSLRRDERDEEHKQ